MKTRNSEVLRSFVDFCEANPSLRFWQALLAWSELPCICACETPAGDNAQDTFHWEGRNK